MKKLFLSSLFITLFSLFLFSPLPAFAQSTDGWTTFQHDAQHSGRSSAIGPKAAYVKWTFNSPDDINGSPAVMPDGSMFLAIGGNGSGLYKISANGETLWIAPMRGTAATPAVAPDGTIYVGTTPDPEVGAGLLYAINPDGTQKWVYEIPHASSGVVTSQTLGLDGTIYTVTTVLGHGQLFAINPDGTLKWTYAFPEIGEAAPTLSLDGTAIYVGQSNGLYAFNLDGSIKWKLPNIGDFYPASPAVGPDGTIYAGAARLTAITPDGVVLWQSAQGGAPALGNGIIYAGGQNMISAINQANGAVLWTFPAFHIRTVPVVDGDNTLYFATDDGKKAYAVKSDGSLLWSYEIGCSQSNASLGPDGTFYIGTSGCPGKFLYAFGPPPPTLTSLSPVKVWLGVPNGQDKGIKVDVKTEIYKDDMLIGQGEVDSIGGLENGIGKVLSANIPFTAWVPEQFPPGSQLKLTISARNACMGSPRSSGTVRLWYNDNKLDSQFTASFDDVPTTYFLRDSFMLDNVLGSHQKSSDIAVGAPCDSFIPFGTWTVTR